MHKKLESMYICSISSGLVNGEWNLFLLFSNGYVWFESKIIKKKKIMIYITRGKPVDKSFNNLYFYKMLN